MVSKVLITEQGKPIAKRFDQFQVGDLIVRTHPAANDEVWLVSNQWCMCVYGARSADYVHSSTLRDTQALNDCILFPNTLELSNRDTSQDAQIR